MSATDIGRPGIGTDKRRAATVIETKEVVVMKGITQRFGDVVANDNIDFELIRGEIHALLGENGAGKSTLMNVLYGLYQPTSGQIYIRGQHEVIKSPSHAIELGIGMVHQHFMLTPPHSVIENIILGLSTGGAFLDMKSAEKKIVELSGKYGLKVNPKAKIWQLSVGEQQRVEIIKALFRDVDILILDEPTSVLTPQEVRSLFATLRSMVNQGLSIIFITHKLDEVMEATDRVTVLRGGKVVGTVKTSSTSKENLAQMMVGRPVVTRFEKSPVAATDNVLEVKSVRAINDRGLVALKDISFNIRRGEILGVAGVDGNGQGELAEVLTGLRKVVGGKIMLEGKDITNRSTREIRDAGVAYTPSDRMHTGTILEYSLAENLVLDKFSSTPFSKGLFLNRSEIGKYAEKLISDFNVRTPGVHIPIKQLSGGNLQKVVLARELSGNPKMIIVHNPTNGLDLGAIEYVHNLLIKKREEGVTILLISTELEEIFALSDRVAVLYEGEIMGIVSGETVNIDQLGLMMGGTRLDSISSHKNLGAKN